ncbi:MAG: ROK family protein [Pseudomonadota bacterium]
MISVGVDLGGSNLRAALVEIDEATVRILDQSSEEISKDTCPKTVANVLVKVVQRLKEAPNSAPIGIGIAGMLQGTSGLVENSPNLGWKNVQFAEIAAACLGCPVWLENDLAAITWGEYRFGAARGQRNTICMFLGTGIGGGAVVEGVPFRGAGNASMEIGHVKVVPGGRLCGCGARGCLEAYAGGRHLVELASKDSSAKLLEIAGGVGKLHPGHLDRAAREGDARSTELIEQAGTFLGRTLADAITLFNPDCLLLGGTVWIGCPRLRKVTLAAIDEYANAPALRRLQIVESELGNDAGVFGAADLATNCHSEHIRFAQCGLREESLCK